jgi:formate dehydrogenase iron-sulfur subunit
MTALRHHPFAQNISRRTFCRRSVAGLTFLAAGSAVTFGEEKNDDAYGAVLVDLTRCIGCRSCENACLIRQGYYGLPVANFGYGTGDGQLTFKTRTFVDFRQVTGLNGNSQHIPVKRQCQHCLDPSCVSVCPVAALEKSPRGSVLWRNDRCIGCRYCLLACPFGVPKYEWNNALTPRVNKCDFCDDQQAAGLSPSCVASCPTGALKFGRRPDMLREMKARLDALPSRYLTMYGDRVVGGTSWFYLSDIPIEQLGFPSDLPKTSMPALTWNWLAKVPFIAIGVGLVLGGIFRLRRREGAVH